MNRAICRLTWSTATARSATPPDDGSASPTHIGFAFRTGTGHPIRCQDPGATSRFPTRPPASAPLRCGLTVLAHNPPRTDLLKTGRDVVRRPWGTGRDVVPGPLRASRDLVSRPLRTASRTRDPAHVSGTQPVAADAGRRQRARAPPGEDRDVLRFALDDAAEAGLLAAGLGGLRARCRRFRCERCG